MANALIEYTHALFFSSFTGSGYLFDASSVTVHPWPWEMSPIQVETLYSVPDASLPSVIDTIGAPPALARYLLNWRHEAGAFGGQRRSLPCRACTEHSDGSAETPSLRPPPSVFSNLVLVLTDACNLRCKYCIFSGHYDDFHTYRPGRMSWETARKAIDHFFTLNDSAPFLALPNRKLDIVFFGGEPLIERDLIRQVVAYINSARRSHYQIDLSATTNLTLLPDSLARFLIENNIGLDVSLDGPRQVHDLYRCDGADRGSFDTVYDNLARLRQLSPEYFATRVRAIVTLNGNSDLAAIRDFFDAGDPCIPRVAFIGAVRDLRDGAFHQRFPYEPERYMNQYYELLADYHRRKRAGVPLVRGDFLYHLLEEPIFALYKRVMRYGDSGFALCPNGCIPGRRLAVSTSGEFHICERINEDFAIGDVDLGVDLDRCQQVQQQYLAALPDCAHCWARGICQFCFASTCRHGDFVFTDAKCADMRESLAVQLRSLYTLFEAVPDGLSCGDPLIDRYRLVQEPV